MSVSWLRFGDDGDDGGSWGRLEFGIEDGWVYWVYDCCFCLFRIYLVI
jgi:hypothetical protein